MFLWFYARPGVYFMDYALKKAFKIFQNRGQTCHWGWKQMNIILYTLYTCTLAAERKQQSNMSFLEFQQLWIVSRIPKESPVWRGQGRSWTPELLQLGSFGGLPPLRRYSLGGEILAPGMVGWRRGKGIEHALNAFATKNGGKKAWCLHRAENQTLQWPAVKKQSWWEGYSILQCTCDAFIFDHLTNFHFHGRLPQKPCANSRTMFWWRRMALRTSRWLRGPLRLALKSCFFSKTTGCNWVGLRKPTDEIWRDYATGNKTAEI